MADTYIWTPHGNIIWGVKFWWWGIYDIGKIHTIYNTHTPTFLFKLLVYHYFLISQRKMH